MAPSIIRRHSRGSSEADQIAGGNLHREERAHVDRQHRGLGLDLNRAAIGARQLPGVNRQADGVDRLDQIGRRAVGDEGIERAHRKGDALSTKLA